MRRIDDYRGEMGSFAISDSDIERILRGQAPEGPGLSRLGSAVEQLRALGSPDLQPEMAARHVALAAEAARDTVPSSPATRPAPAAPRWRLIPRLGASVAAFALVVGMTGMAVASDAAAPGEPLHGVDVFLESLGIGDGGLAERITEARDLTSKGMTVEALDHLTLTFPDEDHSGARDALRTAAERIRGDQVGAESEEIRQGVSEMLEWMAAADLASEEFGQGVAERAQSLGGDDPGLGESGPIDRGQGNGAADQGRGKGRGGPPPGSPGR